MKAFVLSKMTVVTSKIVIFDKSTGISHFRRSLHKFYYDNNEIYVSNTLTYFLNKIITFELQQIS